jgi:Fur family transcriptional regulator, ferric uptake regulator
VADVAEVAARIRAAGGRMTAPRRAVIDALLHAGGHVTAEELATRVERASPGVDRSTIYRNLTALEDAGVVYHVHLAHGPSVYHLSDDEELHAHAVCDRCGAVVELSGSGLRKLAAELKADRGFELGHQHFALTGRCRRCARSRSGARRGRAR